MENDIMTLINERFDKLEKIALLGAKNVLTIEETAMMTGLSKGYIYRLTSSHQIPHYKPSGRNIYFKKDEIENWLLQGRVKTQSEIESEASTYLATH